MKTQADVLLCFVTAKVHTTASNITVYISKFWFLTQSHNFTHLKLTLNQIQAVNEL